MTIREARNGIIFAACLGGIAAIALTAALFSSGCAVAPPPVVEPEVVRINPQAVADCAALWRDELGRDIDPAASDDCASFLTRGLRTLEDYRASIRAGEEYAAYRARLEAERRPKVERLRLSGRHGLVTESTGAKVPWTAVTGFRLVEQVAHGRQAEAVAFLDGIGPARGVRVLLMAVNLFQLSPSEGLAALPETLRLAEAHGKYLEVTIFADTRSFAGLDYRAYAAQVGAICATSPACALLELGNELHSLHPTQAEALGDLALLRSIRANISPAIPVSLGSTHADQDESDRMRDGDFLTIHGARDDGDEGWRWVRHTNEQRALADRVDRWAINDEPRRDDLDCGRQVGIALLARLFSLGDTFHSKSGLFAIPFSDGDPSRTDDDEATAFACRARGWAAVPTAWRGRYLNAGFAGSPVKGFAGAVRVYSSVSLADGNQAYTLVLGATPALRIDWAPDWSRELVVNESGAQLWRLTR